MRNLLTICCLLINLGTLAQTRVFYGRVTDEAKKGIPFAAIQVKGTHEGNYSDDQGNFKISVKSGEATTLIFFCVGYEAKELPMSEARGEVVITLKEKFNQLDEVAITANASKRTGRLRILGKDKLKCEGQAYMNVGTEYGIFLREGAAVGGTLQEVFIYITNLGIPDNRFRIHVYDASNRTKMPLEDITGGNIIAHAEKGNEWVRIDVADKNIKVKDGIIISMEWISGHGNNTAVQEKGVMRYQGQVMGLTTDYGQQNKFVKFPFENRQATNAEWLVPMIYCTYKK